MDQKLPTPVAAARADRADRARLIAFIPALVGLIAFALLGGLYVMAPQAYLSVLEFVGIKPWAHPFIDSEFMYAMKRCWLAGVDVYRAVPCDVVPGNRMAYSPLWQRLPFLPSDKRFTIPIGIGTDLLLILSIMLLPPVRSLREAGMLSLAMISTMVVFALERNNIDVWIYLLIVLGGVLLARRERSMTGYGVFLFVALLKYYPVVCLGLALKERPKRLAIITAISAATILVFAVTFHDELAKSFANVPVGSPFTDMIGAVNLPRATVVFAGQLGYLRADQGPAVEAALRLLVIGFVGAGGVLLALRRDFRHAFEGLSGVERRWLVLGALLVAGCYVAIQNVGYRGVFLLIVLSGLFPLVRLTGGSAIKERLVFTAVSIVPLMWMEGLRHWTDLFVAAAKLPPQAGSSLTIFVWLGRELLWLNLAQVLVGVLFVFLASRRDGAFHPATAGLKG